MTTSPQCASERESSSSFPLLHPKMQRWVHSQGWTTLRDAQERAIRPILEGGRNVVIAAATAAGKTEAAFLPILSALMSAREATSDEPRDPWAAHDPWAEPTDSGPPGVQVLYLSPLKALINDQFRRLDQLCEEADIAVHRWHGDVSSSHKKRLLRFPSGILLTTPESLEAMFVTRGAQVARMMGGLRYAVVDEMHAFIGTARGAQLQSLLHRVDLCVRRRSPRVGLSATLGDMGQAAAFLAPHDPPSVELIESASDERALMMQVRGYLIPRRTAAPDDPFNDEDSVDDTPDENWAMAEHIFGALRGKDNLIFANSRTTVESLADLLQQKCLAERVPNEFWPHHGSLSKEMRESVEQQLKDRSRPASAVCTSTLEMGIDIGSMASIAQVGPPPSVAALLQRLGRSGRRDDPAVLRAYIKELECSLSSSPVDHLRCNTTRAVAMVRLMLSKWIESPDDPGYNYSTLIQQMLSTIAQHGGATPLELHQTLCGPGPFHLVDQARFAKLLRAMASKDLLVQSSDGTLLPGVVGEHQVNHYTFYAAFDTPQEWRLLSGGRNLGTMPIEHPLAEGMALVFAGKRWKVVGIDTEARVVMLERSKQGSPPQFLGNAAPVSDRVREEMRAVYRSSDVPDWLDTQSRALLAEGRSTYRSLGLDEQSVVPNGDGIMMLFPWRGDRALFSASIALSSRGGIKADVEGPAIRIECESTEALGASLQQMSKSSPPTPEDLARFVENPSVGKWDWALSKELSLESVGASLLDVEGAWDVIRLAAEELS